MSRRLTKGDLRILCYHGAELVNESAFRPGLYMTGAKFHARLRYLARHRYPVLALGEALDLRRQKHLPSYATVITIDDGWYGTYLIMAPLLRKYAFPATLYVASYYMEKQTQVFNVAVAYVLWLASGRSLALADVDPSLTGNFDLTVAAHRDEAASAIVALGTSADSAQQRQELLFALCRALGFDGHELLENRVAAFMTASEARELSKSGVDIQLHTHRHRFPMAFELVENEIVENRRALEAVAGSPLVHFCYPSGEYTQDQIPHLQALGIESATTTELGINTFEQSNYELLRILDSETMSQIEFEAEVTGFCDLVRRRSAVRHSP